MIDDDRAERMWATAIGVVNGRFDAIAAAPTSRDAHDGLGGVVTAPRAAEMLLAGVPAADTAEAQIREWADNMVATLRRGGVHPSSVCAGPLVLALLLGVELGRAEAAAWPE